jgi:hypothetical protein
LIVECISYIPPDHHPPPIALTTLGPLTLQAYYTTSSSQYHSRQASMGWTWAILYNFTLKLRFESILYKLAHAHLPYAFRKHELPMGP